MPEDKKKELRDAFEEWAAGVLEDEPTETLYALDTYECCALPVMESHWQAFQAGHAIQPQRTPDRAAFEKWVGSRCAEHEARDLFRREAGSGYIVVEVEAMHQAYLLGQGD